MENLLQLIVSVGGVKSLFGLLILLYLGFLATLFTLNKTKTTLRLSIGPFKISLGSKGFSLTQKNMDLLIDIQQENIKEMIRYEDELLKRQMNYTEQKLSQLKFVLVSKYNQALIKKLGKEQDARTHKDYRNYQILVTILNKELLDKIFRSAFIENHISEMDGQSWEQYLSDKTNYILNYVGEFMDIMYGEGKTLNRQEAADIERIVHDDLKKIIHEIFESIREMCLNFVEELGKIRTESRKKIIEACGKNGINFEDSGKEAPNDP